MAKARSPQYPAIGLKEAIEKARMVYEKDYQNRVPRPVLAEHMGYQSLNGKSLGVLSAVAKFGLVEGRGEENWVSDLALAIIAHDPGTSERVAAIKTAASKPELFAELDTKFGGGKASDSAIRSYLLTQKFIPQAADTAIRSYRETKTLVDAESAAYSSGDKQSQIVPPMSQQAQSPHNSSIVLGIQNDASADEPEPFEIGYTRGRGLVGSFQLKSLADANELIRVLDMWKNMFRPAGLAKRPIEETSDPTEGP